MVLIITDLVTFFEFFEIRHESFRAVFQRAWTFGGMLLESF